MDIVRFNQLLERAFERTTPEGIHDAKVRRLRRSLLTFNSDGFGPVSWSASAVSIETDDGAYLCKWDELES